DNPTQPQQPTKSKRNRHEKKKSSRSGPYPSSSCSAFPRGGHVVIRKLPKTPYVTDVWSKYDLQDNSPSVFASVKEENNGGINSMQTKATEHMCDYNNNNNNNNNNNSNNNN